jgi:hypothetical protein
MQLQLYSEVEKVGGRGGWELAGIESETKILSL